MKRLHLIPTRTQAHRRGGFTLVELLVATGLVVLMMSMFTVVFQLASGSMSTQRGIATNDQRARTVSTIIRDDLKTRTFRVLIPFAHNETDPGTGERVFTNRRGYFYISENDPAIKTDDVLQFTVSIGTDNDPYFGKSSSLGVPESAQTWQANTPYEVGDWVSAAAADGSPAPDGFVYYCETANGAKMSGPLPGPGWTASQNSTVSDNDLVWRCYTPWVSRNQPEWDDGQGGNSTASSPAAEISYFLRNGILYRRVLLVRQTLDPLDDKQPQYSASNPNPTTSTDFFKNTTLGYYSRNRFWYDFDFSGRYDATEDQVKFHGVASLENSSNTGFFPLGDPQNRFGHNAHDPANPNFVGKPKEYILEASSPTFIGRYTLEESSHFDFRYPHKVNGAAGNPMRFSNTALTGLNNLGAVNQYAHDVNAKSRRGEDVLMMNVLSFDVKVWDRTRNEFVDIGYTDFTPPNLSQSFHQNNNKNQTYGPLSSNNRVFDTWHPGTSVGGNNNPPFRPDDGTNPARLRAIQITIEYLDVNSDQVRQITITQSLMN